MKIRLFVLLVCLGFMHSLPAYSHSKNESHLERFPTIIKLQGNVKRAIVHFVPTGYNKNSRGSMYIYQDLNQIRVSGVMAGLRPNATYLIRVHEFGDTSVPSGVKLGAFKFDLLGLFKTNKIGDASFEFTNETVTIMGIRNPILGLGIGVYLDEDFDERDSLGKVSSMGVVGIAEVLD